MAIDRSLHSPKILELSGIGDSAVLAPLGIDVNVHLPPVGTNLQDHALVGMMYREPDHRLRTIRSEADVMTPGRNR